MKKLISALTVISTICAVHTVYADDNIRVYVEGNELTFRQAPVIENNYTLVPMREMFEALGARVTWNEDEQQANGVKSGIMVTITIGMDTMDRNTITVPLDAPARIINDCTMIPLRAVSECFGMDVQWDGANNAIYITDKHTIGTMPWSDNYYYVGEIKDECIAGYGAVHNADTHDVKLIGYFIDGKITEGTSYYDDGVFTGKFSDGMPSEGMQYNYDNGGLYIGEFKYGVKSGHGTYYWENGPYYEGEFKNDQISGLGTVYYTNGDKYIGTYYNGVEYGAGTYYFADGYREESYYIDGKKDGTFKLYSPDGVLLRTRKYYDGLDALEAYKAALEKLNSEYYEKQQELLDFINTSPFATETGKEIMANYGVFGSQSSNNATSSGGYIDSLAAQSAALANAAAVAKGREEAIEAHDREIALKRQILNDWYEQSKKALKEKYDIE